MSYELSDAQKQEYDRLFAAWLLDEVGLTPAMRITLREKDDDWTFIIKVHALLEVALNHMVRGLLIRPELADIVPRMNIHGRTGKMAIAQAFGALSDTHANFIKQISEVRKHLVHDIKNFDFNLAAYVNALDKNRQEEWKNKVTVGYGEPPPQHIRDFSLIVPRVAVYMACMSVMWASFDARPNRLAELYRIAMMNQESQTLDESTPKES